MEEKDFTVNLYLVGLSIKLARIDAAHFAWLPEEIIQECQNKTDEECGQYYHEHYIVEVGPDGQIMGYRRDWVEQRSKKYPQKVMTSWIYDERILEQLEQINFVQELMKTDKREMYYQISDNRKVHAQIHWELWPNGQNFRILELLP